LLDTRGDFSSDRPPRLEDYLKVAKDKIYLEIDFKSSAKYARVIDLIREYDMADQVILISYNRKQAKILARLAPEMMISATVKQSAEVAKLEALGVKRSNITAWLGRALEDDVLTGKLSKMNIPVLGMMGHQAARKKTIAADLLVTDYAFDHKPIAGLSSKSQAVYKACLNGG
jgi:glycerophosphoryl diester phosphodiesterase